MSNHEYIFPIEHMVGEFDNFIALWRKFIPRQICEQIVEKFDKVLEHSAQTCDVGKEQFPSRKMGRDDLQIILNDYDVNLANTINDYLKCCLTHYCQEYSQLIGVKLMSYAIKAQKTPPGGGYHEWHYENASYQTSNRELVWTIYLNDMPDGEAETEFLYQRRRIKPEQGMVCVFPAGLTHVHKGNTVFTTDKYILTGWAHKVQ